MNQTAYLLWRIWPFARRRLGKHRLKTGIATLAEVHLLGNGSLVSATTDNRQKHELFGAVAAIRSFRSYKREFIRELESVPRVEAGSNTSTVTLRVVGCDEMGSLKCETVKYGCETQGARSKEGLRWQGPAAYIKVRPVLSSERVRHKKKP
jgi:hypothetical protein